MDILCGASYEDSSFLRMTRLGLLVVYTLRSFLRRFFVPQNDKIEENFEWTYFAELLTKILHSSE
ncbi:MAG: hypothetical protein EOO19_11040 [Chryseobacterium sp.]|nr:MAG: hypothetical protein EOO19_11040 [Chryseobacterium sp.]